MSMTPDALRQQALHMWADTYKSLPQCAEDWQQVADMVRFIEEGKAPDAPPRPSSNAITITGLFPSGGTSFGIGTGSISNA